MRVKHIVNIYLIALVTVGVAQASDIWTVALTPGTAISGPAGSTIGWGYDITNQSTDKWLGWANLTENPFQNVSTLDAVFDYPILAPGATAVANYVAGSSGLLGLTWSSSAPLFFVNSGNFILSADWYDGDPFGAGNDLGAAPQQTVGYTAQVSGTTTSSPEPATSGLGLGCLFLLVIARLWNRRKMA